MGFVYIGILEQSVSCIICKSRLIRKLFDNKKGSLTVISISISTGWERKVHMTPSVDLYSGQIIVENMSGKFQIVYLYYLKLSIGEVGAVKPV